MEESLKNMFLAAVGECEYNNDYYKERYERDLVTLASFRLNTMLKNR